MTQQPSCCGSFSSPPDTVKHVPLLLAVVMLILWRLFLLWKYFLPPTVEASLLRLNQFHLLDSSCLWCWENHFIVLICERSLATDSQFCHVWFCFTLGSIHLGKEAFDAQWLVCVKVQLLEVERTCHVLTLVTAHFSQIWSLFSVNASCLCFHLQCSHMFRFTVKLVSS